MKNVSLFTEKKTYGVFGQPDTFLYFLKKCTSKHIVFRSYNFFTRFPSGKHKVFGLPTFLFTIKWDQRRENHGKTLPGVFLMSPPPCLQASMSATLRKGKAREGTSERQPRALRRPLNTEAHANNHTNTYTCGMVVLKISIIQLHVLSQTSGLNFSPLDITKFSKQLVPDRANCSLSARQNIVSLNFNCGFDSNQTPDASHCDAPYMPLEVCGLINGAPQQAPWKFVWLR